MKETMKCERCGKPGHSFNECKAGGFKKLWPGRNVIEIHVRYRDGSTFKVSGPVSDKQRDEVTAMIARHMGEGNGRPAE